MNITVVEMVARSEFDFLMMYITEIVISVKYSENCTVKYLSKSD